MHNRVMEPMFDHTTTDRISSTLQDRLIALIDAGLTFKHAHWNVSGPGFIAAHEFLDEQTSELRLMADETAERIATVGGTPKGLAGFVARGRTNLDYPVMSDSVTSHFTVLSEMLRAMIADFRAAIDRMEADDKVSADMLTDHTKRLEMIYWLTRSHLESSSRASDEEAVDTRVFAGVGGS